VARAWP